MLLFWERGYEGTTLDALLEVMGGISPPSFYNAFGSKEALFREAVDRYVATVGAVGVEELTASPSAVEGIRQFLIANVRSMAGAHGPRGCLLVSGAVNCTPGSQAAEAYVGEYRRQAPDAILARLARAVAEGELPGHTDISLVAGFYVMVLHGLAQRAVDGESSDRLEAMAVHAMAAWSGFVSHV